MPGLLIHDAFTGNSAAPESALREKFSGANNILIYKGIPGGWSANGQPCDAVHQYFRALGDSFQTIALGLSKNPLLRQRLDELTHTSTSFGKRSMSWQSVIESDIWAWQHMPDKLMRYAWVSRGCQMWHTGSDIPVVCTSLGGGWGLPAPYTSQGQGSKHIALAPLASLGSGGHPTMYVCMYIRTSKFASAQGT